MGGVTVLRALAERSRFTVTPHSGGELRRDRERAERDHFRAVALLMSTVSDRDERERLDRALESLGSAVDAEPDNPVYRSDLAAAYWQRGVLSGGGLDDRIAALEHSSTAVELAPGAPEPAFNLALALDALYLWDQALLAYERYLVLDSSSGWARWVRHRIVRLGAVDPISASERRKEALAAAALSADVDGLRELVGQDPQAAREYGETELLSRWAVSRDESEATESLLIARRIGEALRSVNGDSLLFDAVNASDTAEARAGLAAWGAAQPFLARREYEKALPNLREARRLSDLAHNPIGRWAALHEAIFEYQRDAYESAALRLSSLTEASDAGRYPSLLAHARRVEGLIHQILGRAEAAKRLGGEAVQTSASLGEVEAASNHGVPLVGVLTRLGEEVAADRLLLAALEQRPTSTRADHLYVAYWAVNARLGRQGRWALAERFQREAVAQAERAGDPVLLGEAYRQLAEVLERHGGRSAEAVAALDRSSEEVQALESDSARVYLDTMNRLARSRILAIEDPHGALEELDATVDYLRATRFEHLLPRVLAERAVLHGELEWTVEAEADLLEAAALVENHRSGIADPHFRLSVYSEAQRIYRDLAVVVHAEDPARAFGYADRARARVLADWLRDGGYRQAVDRRSPFHSPGLLVESVGSALPDRAVLVEYLLGPDLALAWTVSRAGELRQVELPLNGTEIESLVGRLKRSWGKRDGGVLTVLEELHESLIAPLGLEPDHGPVVIVPQGALESVPFSALRAPESGSFLIERSAVLVSPSAELVAEGASRMTRSELPVRRALVIGDPAFDPRRHPDLRRLPGARREAEMIHDLYRQAGREAEVLVDHRATRVEVLDKAGRFDVVHLAAHALPVPRRPLLATVVLAQSGDGSERQGLTGLDVSALDLADTRIVVLSTCEGFRGTTDDGLLGLILPILTAGAHAVVASVRPADDEQTPGLMVDLHRGVLDGLSASDALRRAKIASIERGRSVEEWSGFEVFGSLE